MRDVEMVIRYFTFKYFLNEYRGNLKSAFDNTVNKLNKSWEKNKSIVINDAENLNEAIKFTIELFGSQKSAFSKWNGKSFQGNFNRAIFDIMAYYFSNQELREEATLKKEQILLNA